MDKLLENFLEDRVLLRLIQLFARRITRAIGDRSYEEFDVHQDLLLNLRHCSKNYDSSKSSFQTFAKMALRHYADSIIKHHNAAKRCALGGMVYLDQDYDTDEDGASLHELIGSTDCHPAWPASQLRRDHQDLAYDLGRTLRKLPDRLRETADALQRMSATEAADKLGIHRSVLYDRRADLCRYFDGASLRIYLQK